MPVTEPNFSSIIDQLREENERLSQQLQEAERKADAEREQRNIAEELNRQSCTYKAQLEKDVEKYAGAAAFFQRIVEKCAADMEKVWPALQDVKRHISEGTILERSMYDIRRFEGWYFR